MKSHDLKIQDKYFESAGKSKLFEVRLNDRNYKVDDIVVLNEIDRNGLNTGRVKVVKITYVLYLKDCSFLPEAFKKYCVFAFTLIYEEKK